MAAPGVTLQFEGDKKYRLGPFLVSAGTKPTCGCWARSLPRLFEQFVIEGGGERIFSPRPGVLGVVPVRGSLKPELMWRFPPRHRRPFPKARAISS